MTTHVTTRNPVRADLDTTGDSTVAPSAPTRPTRRTSKGWALAGVAAGVLGIGTMVSSSMINAIYDKDIALDEDAILAKLADQSTQIMVFQVVASLTALALVVFAAGLHRRLASRLDDSIVPAIASAGLVGTAVITVLGSGLNTEFALDVEEHVLAANAAMFNHWTGTIPWVWLLAGLSALAVASAWRQGAVPRWMGITSLVLGGLTVVSGTLPIQYMAILPGSLWVLVLSIGFLVGDKAHRSAG
jgi:hypothetical protein